MTDLEALTRDYRVAFLRYLPQQDERALALGYEIGRAAVGDGVSVLHLAQVHHAILTEVLSQTSPEELREVATAASEFFLEVLATFQMAQGGGYGAPDASGGDV